jgi:aspartyl protease family protein
VSQRGNLGKVVQYAAIWGFIFIGAIVAVGLWTDIRQTVTPRQSVMMDGARVEVPQAFGRALLPHARCERCAPIRFVVDTGATDLVLTRADAARAGIDTDGADLFGAGLHRQRNGSDCACPPGHAWRLARFWTADARVRAVVNGARNARKPPGDELPATV